MPVAAVIAAVRAPGACATVDEAEAFETVGERLVNLGGDEVRVRAQVVAVVSKGDGIVV